MKVYLVRTLENEKYCNYDVAGVFSTKEKAENYIKENVLDIKVSVWFCEDGIDEAYVEEMEVF